MLRFKPVLISSLFVLLFVASVETFARLALGLGTPPLSEPHETIEYMFKPNQNVMRFNNRQIYNSQGMRSGEIPPNVGRVVLTFGDSVLNGGSLTDHADLATSLLQRRLSNETQSVFVGNVSAGSWGPGNISAWINEFGMFGADTAIFVFSAHDLDDHPSFDFLDPSTHPTKSPMFASTEAVQRYLPRFVPELSMLSPAKVRHPFAHRRPQDGFNGTEEIFSLIKSAKAREICLIQHATPGELLGEVDPRQIEIARIFESEGAKVLWLPDFFPDDESIQSQFRDEIHLNERGQQALSLAMWSCLN